MALGSMRKIVRGVTIANATVNTLDGVIHIVEYVKNKIGHSEEKRHKISLTQAELNHINQGGKLVIQHDGGEMYYQVED